MIRSSCLPASAAHKQRSRRAACCALCSLLVGVLWGQGCSRRPEARGSAKGETSGVPVAVAVAKQKTTAVEAASFGTVEPYASVAIKAQVTGVLTQVHFVEGQMVKKGDPLLSIDPRQPEVALKAAQAALDGNKAQLKNAEREAARQTELLQKGFAAQDEVDRSVTAAETLRAAVAADEAAIENASLQLDYCSIRSPIDGRAGSLHVHQGNLIKADDVSVVTIMQTEPIYVSFSALEELLPAIRKAMAARDLDVRVAQPRSLEPPLHGILSLIENTVDVDSRTIRLRASFSNADERLWPGQYVDVVLTIAQEPNSIVVPSQSVQTGQNGQFLYVVKSDQTVEARPVTVTRAMDTETVVEGVQAGEVVVTDGQLRLVPGARVQTKEPPQR